MDKICPICAKDPTSHSFKFMKEKNGNPIFYMKPATATKYDDGDGLVAHIENALNAIGDKRWIWIIDGEGMEAKHAAELTTAQRVYRLIRDRYGAQLRTVKIINPSWHMKAAIKLGWDTMDATVREKTEILEDRYRSIIEFL